MKKVIILGLVAMGAIEAEDALSTATVDNTVTVDKQRHPIPVKTNVDGITKAYIYDTYANQLGYYYRLVSNKKEHDAKLDLQGMRCTNSCGGIIKPQAHGNVYLKVCEEVKATNSTVSYDSNLCSKLVAYAKKFPAQ